MKRLISCVLAVAMMFTMTVIVPGVEVQAEPQIGNVLKNGDFSNGTMYWDISSIPGAEVVDEWKGNTDVIKIPANSGGNLYQAVTVKPGVSYELSYKIYSNGSNCNVTCNAFNPYTKTLGGQLTSNNWGTGDEFVLRNASTMANLKFTDSSVSRCSLLPAGIEMLAVRVQSNNVDVYVDDIQLIGEIPDPSIDFSRNYVNMLDGAAWKTNSTTNAGINLEDSYLGKECASITRTYTKDTDSWTGAIYNTDRVYKYTPITPGHKYIWGGYKGGNRNMGLTDFCVYSVDASGNLVSRLAGCNWGTDSKWFINVFGNLGSPINSLDNVLTPPDGTVGLAVVGNNSGGDVSAIQAGETVDFTWHYADPFIYDMTDSANFDPSFMVTSDLPNNAVLTETGDELDAYATYDYNVAGNSVTPTSVGISSSDGSKVEYYSNEAMTDKYGNSANMVEGLEYGQSKTVYAKLYYFKNSKYIPFKMNINLTVLYDGDLENTNPSYWNGQWDKAAGTPSIVGSGVMEPQSGSTCLDLPADSIWHQNISQRLQPGYGYKVTYYSKGGPTSNQASGVQVFIGSHSYDAGSPFQYKKRAYMAQGFSRTYKDGDPEGTDWVKNELYYPPYVFDDAGNTPDFKLAMRNWGQTVTYLDNFSIEPIKPAKYYSFMKDSADEAYDNLYDGLKTEAVLDDTEAFKYACLKLDETKHFQIPVTEEITAGDSYCLSLQTTNLAPIPDTLTKDAELKVTLKYAQWDENPYRTEPELIYVADEDCPTTTVKLSDIKEYSEAATAHLELYDFGYAKTPAADLNGEPPYVLDFEYTSGDVSMGLTCYSLVQLENNASLANTEDKSGTQQAKPANSTALILNGDFEEGNRYWTDWGCGVYTDGAGIDGSKAFVTNNGGGGAVYNTLLPASTQGDLYKVEADIKLLNPAADGSGLKFKINAKGDDGKEYEMPREKLNAIKDGDFVNNEVSYVGYVQAPADEEAVKDDTPFTITAFQFGMWAHAGQYSVDNIRLSKVSKADVTALVTAKINDYYADKIDEDLYTPDGVTALQKIKNDCISSFEDAENYYEAMGLIEQAVIDLEDVPTYEDVLAEEIESAKGDLDDYVAALNETDYTVANWQSIQSIVNEGKTVLDGLSAIEDVKTNYDDMIDDIDEVDTIAEETIRVAKQTAIDALNSYVDKADYRDAQKTEIQTAIDNAISVINSATTTQAIDDAVASCKAILDDVKTDAELTEEEATPIPTPVPYQTGDPTVTVTPGTTSAPTATPTPTQKKTPAKKVLKFAKKKITVKKGKKVGVKVSSKNINKISFKSSKSKIAKILKKSKKKIIIKGIKKGKATITAKGSGKKATLKVVVK